MSEAKMNSHPKIESRTTQEAASARFVCSGQHESVECPQQCAGRKLRHSALRWLKKEGISLEQVHKRGTSLEEIGVEVEKLSQLRKSADEAKERADDAMKRAKESKARHKAARKLLKRQSRQLEKSRAEIRRLADEDDESLRQLVESGEIPKEELEQCIGRPYPVRSCAESA